MYNIAQKIVGHVTDCTLVCFNTGVNELSEEDGQLRPQSSVSSRNVSSHSLLYTYDRYHVAV